MPHSSKLTKSAQPKTQQLSELAVDDLVTTETLDLGTDEHGIAEKQWRLDLSLHNTDMLVPSHSRVPTPIQIHQPVGIPSISSSTYQQDQSQSDPNQMFEFSKNDGMGNPIDDPHMIEQVIIDDWVQFSLIGHHPDSHIEGDAPIESTVEQQAFLRDFDDDDCEKAMDEIYGDLEAQQVLEKYQLLGQSDFWIHSNTELCNSIWWCINWQNDWCIEICKLEGSTS